MINSVKEYSTLNEELENNNMFIPQRKESAVSIVINNIKRLLLTKQILPGDKLPNENDLAKFLSVSRGSVREAMKILSSFGVVEVKQGDGSYVSRKAGNSLFDPLLFSLILEEPDIEELSEFRQMMEIEVVNIIIKNANEEDIKGIENIYLDMEKRINNNDFDSSVLTKCDLNFHYALGKATKNKLVDKTYAYILDFFTPSIEKSHFNQKDGQNALASHKEILDALKEKNLDKAVKSIENSVILWKQLSSS